MHFPKYLEKIIENVGTVLLNLYYISLLWFYDFCLLLINLIFHKFSF